MPRITHPPTLLISPGQHFGTLATLSVGEKKRPFTAVAAEPCEFAVISRVGYNRIMKKQLKGTIDSRADMVKSMAIMNDATELIIQRVAFNSQSETFAPGMDEGLRVKHTFV